MEDSGRMYMYVYVHVCIPSLPSLSAQWAVAAWSFGWWGTSACVYVLYTYVHVHICEIDRWDRERIQRQRLKTKIETIRRDLPAHLRVQTQGQHADGEGLPTGALLYF